MSARSLSESGRLGAGKPAVLPGEHVGGGRGVERASEPEPSDHAAAHPLGDRGHVCGGDWPGRQERRRCVQARFGSSRHEDAVGHARVEMHVVVLALTGCFAGICFRHDIDTSDVQLWMATLVIQAIPYAAAVGMAIISARNKQ